MGIRRRGNIIENAHTVFCCRLNWLQSPPPPPLSYQSLYIHFSRLSLSFPSLCVEDIGKGPKYKNKPRVTSLSSIHSRCSGYVNISHGSGFGSRRSINNGSGLLSCHANVVVIEQNMYEISSKTYNF
jgi:hypothetical protein